LQEALIVNKLDYFSYKNNQELINTSKYFATDHGMRNVLMQEKISGYGRIIENIVYIELLRRNYIVKGLITTNNKEIDFLITKDNMSINLQVCKTLDKDNYDSEIGNFNYLNNRNKCVILCESVSDDIEINNGVIVVNVID
jgi:predicted AAA+ superfamily ATPase